MNLILPGRVAIQLTDTEKLPLTMAGVLLRIRLFARRRNDFILQPFASDGEGLFAILTTELEVNVEAAYDSDLMGHVSVSECFPSVEICLLSAYMPTGLSADCQSPWRSKWYLHGVQR
jgi:hypothetical protein